jgi:hypothetical protein
LEIKRKILDRDEDYEIEHGIDSNSDVAQLWSFGVNAYTQPKSTIRGPKPSSVLMLQTFQKSLSLSSSAFFLLSSLLFSVALFSYGSRSRIKVEIEIKDRDRDQCPYRRA